MQHLSIGNDAPDFTLAGDGGKPVSLSQHRGSIVILFFYPADDTPSCTTEAIGFSELKPEFDRIGAVLVGISPDTVAKHDRFKAKHGLETVLAADVERSAIDAYGLWGEKTLYGRTYLGVERASFLIDRDGRIAGIWRKVRVKGHAQAVLEAARLVA